MKTDMLVITDIRIETVPKYDKTLYTVIKTAQYASDVVEYSTETVKGRIFIDSFGQRVCIGMTKEVQDTIGLPFEAFSNMEKLINLQGDMLSAAKNKYNRLLQSIDKAGFLARLRYLFSKSLFISNKKEKQ